MEARLSWPMRLSTRVLCWPTSVGCDTSPRRDMEEGLGVLAWLTDQKMFGLIGLLVGAGGVWFIDRGHFNDLKDEIKWLRERHSSPSS